MSEKIYDIEITVRCWIPRAVSKTDLSRYYNNDPLHCARALADNDQGLCGTIDCNDFEILSAKLSEQP